MLGDPTEAGAISNVFTARTADDPIYIGALKSNIGHPEAASGIAGIIKTVLVLEAGIIPPNMYPERINPAIASSCANLTFPLTPTPWPIEGVRRASVNSFGYGGTNVHVIMDVLSYITSQKLSARHCSRVLEKHKTAGPDDEDDFNARVVDEKDDNLILADPLRSKLETPTYRLLVLSAFDDRAVQRSISSHEEWLRSRAVSTELLADLAYTLTARRLSFSWRAFCVASSTSVSDLVWCSPTRMKQKSRLCFVFTGQGAAWQGMARELCRFGSFRKSVLDADRYLKTLGSKWSVAGKLHARA